MEIRHLNAVLPQIVTNCYLLLDETSGALAVIDPGADLSQRLQTLCQENGWDLRHIFLTHSHPDHIGGVAPLRQAFPGVAVHIHPDDTGRYDPRVPVEELGELKLWRDGDVVPLGALQVEVLHTPGHTRGSVCLRCQDVLFTGDTLFAGSMGRTDFPGGNDEQMMASLKRLGQLEGDYQVLPGHNEFTTLDRERECNPYLRRAMEL